MESFQPIGRVSHGTSAFERRLLAVYATNPEFSLPYSTEMVEGEATRTDLEPVLIYSGDSVQTLPTATVSTETKESPLLRKPSVLPPLESDKVPDEPASWEDKKVCKGREEDLADPILKQIVMGWCRDCTVRLVCLKNDLANGAMDTGIIAGFTQGERWMLIDEINRNITAFEAEQLTEQQQIDVSLKTKK